MPSWLQLEICTGTQMFHKIYKMWASAGYSVLYARQNQYGGSRYVAITRTSKKCIRVIYIDNWDKRDDGLKNKSEYCSFRTLYELCRYLDTLV